MHWIYMLVGLAIGAGAGSFSVGLFLALIGLAIGLQQLQNKNEALRKKLDALASHLGAAGKAQNPQRAPAAGAAAAEVRGDVPAPAMAQTPVPAAPARAPAEDEGGTGRTTIQFPKVPAPPVVNVLLSPPQPARVVFDKAIVSIQPFEAAASPPAPLAPPASSAADRAAPSLPMPAAPPSAAPRAPRPAAPAKPAEPAGPSPLERAFALARGWLFGGNTVLRVGVLLLFLGLAFLLRYATEGMVMPPQAPYIGTAAAALALLGLGWWLRGRKTAYALVLQGTGVAVLYLTVFAAIKLYPQMNGGEVLVSPGAGFVLLVVVTLCSAVLAVLQDALGLAAAAALGGFAAPILTSSGGGSHVALFSYFALLNAGIFAIAWFKAWRPLNLIGFVGTFGIGFAWGLRSYRPELFASTEAFLVLFFLMYVAIGLLFTRRRLREAQGLQAGASRDEQLRWSVRQTDYLDASVLFGTPLVGFGLQYALIRHIEFGAAFSALALGLFYMGMARVLAGRAAGRALLLVESCIALGVVFGTLAIPLGLDARWTSAAWAVEGAGIYWIGLRQGRRLARVFALLLQAGAALAYLNGLGFDIRLATVLDGSPLGALMLGAALLFSFWQLRLHLRRDGAAPLMAWEGHGVPVLACAGLAFLYLIAPLCLAVQGTAIAWALAGLATLLIGLRLRERSFLACAFAVQLLGGVLFLLRLRGADGGQGVFASGWQGLMTASLIGLALVAGMLIAARDPLVKDDRRLMGGLTAVLLLGLAFINLAVLFVLPWRAASAVWGGSGLLILWLGLRLRQRACFAFGLALQVIGGAAFLLNGPALFDALPSEGLKPLAHMDFWAPAVLALAALFGAWRLHRAAAAEQGIGFGALDSEALSRMLLLWGAGWWAFAALGEIARFVPTFTREHVALLVAAASAGLWMPIARRVQWRALALLCLALVPLALLALASAWRPDYHPLANLGWLGWPAVAVVHLLSLRLLQPLLPDKALRAAHVLGCWLIVGVLALELRYLLFAMAAHYNAWRWLGWALVPSLFLALMGSPRAWPWPVSAFGREYRGIAAAPMALALLGWFWLANLASNGAADPLPYLPLLNPLELGMLIVLAAVCRWALRGLPLLGVPAGWLGRPLQALAGASLFALATMAVCRAAHHWGGVPFDSVSLQASMVVQAGLSIVWALIALALMIAGHLRGRREAWMAGAVLIAVVVVKLFFVELGNSGSLARIVSFIGVGVLMLVVGYFAPLPPRRSEGKQEQVSA